MGELVGWWGGCVVDGLVGGVTDAGAVEGGVGLWLVVKGSMGCTVGRASG